MRREKIRTLSRKMVRHSRGELFFRSPAGYGRYRPILNSELAFTAEEIRESYGKLDPPFQWTDGRYIPREMNPEEFGHLIGLCGIGIDLSSVEFFRAKKEF